MAWKACILWARLLIWLVTEFRSCKNRPGLRLDFLPPPPPHPGVSPTHQSCFSMDFVNPFSMVWKACILWARLLIWLVTEFRSCKNRPGLHVRLDFFPLEKQNWKYLKKKKKKKEKKKKKFRWFKCPMPPDFVIPRSPSTLYTCSQTLLGSTNHLLNLSSYIGLLHLKSIHPLWKILEKCVTWGVWIFKCTFCVVYRLGLSPRE